MSAYQITQTITDPGTAPARTDPDNFDARADAFLLALSAWGAAGTGDLNVLATQMNALSTAVNGYATAAEAAQAATEAASGATEWLVGTTYDEGDIVWGSNYLSYRAAQGSNTGHNPVGDGGTWWVQISGGVYANKNAIINGAFNVWQRGTSFALGSTAYMVDRFMCNRAGEAAGGTLSRITGDTQPYGVRLQRDNGNAGTEAISMYYANESVNSVPFRGKYLTLSFRARMGAGYTGANSRALVSIRTGTGTDESPTSMTGVAIIATAIATLTTSWQSFSVTTPAVIAGTVTQIGLKIDTEAFVGTAGASDYVDIEAVQLELGSVATDFEYRDYGTELAMCQRYYYREAPGTANRPVGVGRNRTTTVQGTMTQFPVPMRIAPTALEQTGTATDYGVLYLETNAVSSAVPTFFYATKYRAVSLFTTAAVLTAGQASYGACVSASAYLGWSAEL